MPHSCVEKDRGVLEKDRRKRKKDTPEKKTTNVYNAIVYYPIDFREKKKRVKEKKDSRLEIKTANCICLFPTQALIEQGGDQCGNSYTSPGHPTFIATSYYLCLYCVRAARAPRLCGKRTSIIFTKIKRQNSAKTLA